MINRDINEISTATGNCFLEADNFTRYLSIIYLCILGRFKTNYFLQIINCINFYQAIQVNVSNLQINMCGFKNLTYLKNNVRDRHQISPNMS